MSFDEIAGVTGWVNGKKRSRCSLLDRGLAFGDGVFETILIENNQVKLLECHLVRLQQSCNQLFIDLDSDLLVKELKKVLFEAAKDPGIKRWRLKIMVTRGASNSGYVASAKSSGHRIFILSALNTDIDRIRKEGVNTRFCDWVLPIQPRLAGIKHLNRLDQVMARLEWNDTDIFEGFMRDVNGCLIEGTCTNLFVVNESGDLQTPLLEGSGVTGVMRQVVMHTLCAEVGLTCQEVKITALDHVQEIFITNAIIGIVPVKSVENRQFQIGSKTRQLQEALNACDFNYEK